MSWDQPQNKTKEELTASEQDKRQEVIKNYTSTLNDIEKRIGVSKNLLDKLNNDTDQVHAKRLEQYAKHEDILKNQEQELVRQRKELDDKEEDLNKRNLALNTAIMQETQRAQSHTTSFLAHKDQLDAQKLELDQYAEKQIEVSNIQANTQKEHVERKKDLDQATIDINKATDALIVKHHELKTAEETHQAKVEAFIVGVNDLEVHKNENKEFNIKLLEREKDLEVLQKKYEDGLILNQVESLRLKDLHLEVYKIKVEADNRIKLAVESEQRAQEKIANLQSLKNDIHTKIKEN